MTRKYKEGQTVNTATYISQDTGEWPTDMDGTLMAYQGRGEWDVYVPGHGQVTVHERTFV